MPVVELSPSQTSIGGSWGTLCRVPGSPALEFASSLGLHSCPGVTWEASGGPSFRYSVLLRGSGMSFGHPAPKDLCIRGCFWLSCGICIEQGSGKSLMQRNGPLQRGMWLPEGRCQPTAEEQGCPQACLQLLGTGSTSCSGE